MRVVTLSRILAVFLWLKFFMVSLTTCAPVAQEFGRRLQRATGAIALLGTISAVFISQLPADHWMHRSRGVCWFAGALTAIATMIVATGSLSTNL